MRAGEQLRAQLKALAVGAGTVRAHAESSWPSGAFSFTRHRLQIRFASGAEIERAEAMLAALPDHQFIIPGQLVASIAVVAMDQVNGDAPRLDVTIEAVLMEER